MPPGPALACANSPARQTPMPLPAKRVHGPHLFVPANRAGFLTRLPLLPVTAVILDLEYATRWPHKHEARFLAAEAIPYLRELLPELTISVRINVPAAGDLALRDLDVIVAARPDVIRVPSVESGEDLRRIDAHLGACERAAAIAEGSIRLHPLIESPRGLAEAAAIAGASPRNEALCLGGEDWAHNVGAVRSREGRELDHVRASLVAIAAEHRLVAIDTVYNWLDDDEGLARDCAHSRSLGFRGRACIHPRQLATIAGAYAPDDAQVERARALLDKLVEAEVGGTRVHLVDGVITDPRAIFQARLTCLAAAS